MHVRSRFLADNATNTEAKTDHMLRGGCRPSQEEEDAGGRAELRMGGGETMDGIITTQWRMGGAQRLGRGR